MIVITGASGLLGTIIAEKFSSAGFAVTALYNTSTPPTINGVVWKSADVTDIHALNEIFKGATCVVHAAALVSFNQRNRAKMFKVNVEGTANVVNACLQCGVRRLIHVSSVAALEKKRNATIITENNEWTGAGNPSNYGQTKHLAELEIFRGEAEGLSVAMVNPSIILSAGNTHRSSGQILQYVADERPFYTDGILNYVDARDVAEMIFRLSQNINLKGRFIANAATISWQNLFRDMATKLGKRPPYIKVNTSLTHIAAAFEWCRSALLGKEPLVTRETATLARMNVFYSNEKAIQELEMTFRNFDETLTWCCQSLKNKNSVKV